MRGQCPSRYPEALPLEMHFFGPPQVSFRVFELLWANDMYPTPFLPKIWGLKQIKLFCRESLKINPIPSFPLIQLHLRNRGFASIWQSAKKILIIWIGCLWYLFTEWSSVAHLSPSFFCSKSSLTSSARQTLKVQGRYHAIANQPKAEQRGWLQE